MATIDRAIQPLKLYSQTCERESIKIVRHRQLVGHNFAHAPCTGCVTHEPLPPTDRRSERNAVGRRRPVGTSDSVLLVRHAARLVCRCSRADPTTSGGIQRAASLRQCLYTDPLITSGVRRGLTAVAVPCGRRHESASANRTFPD